jgi:hypothetical protein
MAKSDDVCVGGHGGDLILLGLRWAAYVARIVKKGSTYFLKGGHLEDCLIIYRVMTKVEVTVTACISFFRLCQWFHNLRTFNVVTRRTSD